MLTRRLASVAMAISSVVAAPSFGQQDYPNKPIRLIVPFPPGGITDGSARVIAERLGARLGQQIVVENRGGAQGNIGSQSVARALPDGYTLLLGVDSTLAVNPHLFAKIPFDPIRDFVPISKLGDINLILVAHPSFAPNNLAELVALDKQKPGTIPFGTAGIGSNGHMLVALLSARTSMQLVHVPYKGGGPAIIDVVGGQIPLVGTGVVSAIQQVRNGSVKAIGVGSANRDPALPNVPTFAESGLPGFLCLGWTGIVAPTGTPRAIIDRLQREIGAALGEKEVRDRYATMGIAAHGTTSEEFAELIRTDLVKWGNVIREAGIKAE